MPKPANLCYSKITESIEKSLGKRIFEKLRRLSSKLSLGLRSCSSSETVRDSCVAVFSILILKSFQATNVKLNFFHLFLFSCRTT